MFGRADLTLVTQAGVNKPIQHVNSHADSKKIKIGDLRSADVVIGQQHCNDGLVIAAGSTAYEASLMTRLTCNPFCQVDDYIRVCTPDTQTYRAENSAASK